MSRRLSLFRASALAVLLMSYQSYAAASAVYQTTSAMVKIRRDDAAPPVVTQVKLEAAQNEFEKAKLQLARVIGDVPVRVITLDTNELVLPTSSSAKPISSGSVIVDSQSSSSV